MTLPYILLLLYFLVLLSSLWKIFEKAGRKSWEAFVPGYNLLIWLKITGKPWWWILFMLVPGVNLLMLVIMNVNLSIIMGDRSLKEHVMMVFLPWVMLPKLAFQDAYKHVGLPPADRKRNLGNWGDAILFAVIAATVIRTFTFEAYTIPTPSMENSLLVGDYLFVSKMSYGARMPMTPIAFPLVHHTLPFSKTAPSYVRWFSQDYRRLPGFGDVERGDAVVFNFPEGDTVVANFQNQSYYQLLRDHGREKIWDERYRMPAMVNGQVRNLNTGGILVRPLDKKENYIKRCVAVAGDELKIVDGEVFINGEAQPMPEFAMYDYELKLKDQLNPKRLKQEYDIDVQSDAQQGANGGVSLPFTEADAEKMKDNPVVLSMDRQNTLSGAESPYHTLPIFPNHPDYNWTADNFGPIRLPKAGEKMEINTGNLPLYERAIRHYEGNELEVRDGKVIINGVESDSYTFKQNYYWMMGDNRHRSQDSRFWGFVPEDHVVGKAVFIWMSADPAEGGFPGGIRWKRLFSFVD